MIQTILVFATYFPSQYHVYKILAFQAQIKSGLHTSTQNLEDIFLCEFL